jgi:hypothetical protein
MEKSDRGIPDRNGEQRAEPTRTVFGRLVAGGDGVKLAGHRAEARIGGERVAEATTDATGRFLLRPDGAAPRRIAKAEVPRSGAVVTNTWQRARGVDGRILQWVEQRRVTGRGEGSSGLAFDTVAPGTEG